MKKDMFVKAINFIKLCLAKKQQILDLIMTIPKTGGIEK